MTLATTSSQLAPPQKAAALVIAVGSQNAASLLKHLDEDEVEALVAEVARLGKMDADVLEGVMQEVHDQVLGHRLAAMGGPQLAREMLMQWRGASGTEILDRILGVNDQHPFAFIRDVDPEQLVQFLKEEHPQTVALILAHQPASYAAQVLSGFEEDIQREVAIRVATLGRISPDVMPKVETALKTRLGSTTRTDTRTRGGVKNLAEMLNHADRTTEKAILERLDEVDPELASQVRALMFVFEDIAKLDDRSIQQVIQTVDSQKLAIALKGVRPDVQEAVERNLSARARETLLEEIELLGPMRRRDVEAVQTEIVARVRELDEAGEIMIARDSGDLVG